MPHFSEQRGFGAWLRLWPVALLALAVVGLAAAEVIPTWSGLVYLVGIPPLDMFADMRLLLVIAPTWPAFIGLVVVLAAVRIAVLAYLLGGLDWRRLRFAGAFYAIAAGPALISAQASYMGYAVLYVRIFWISIAITVLTFIVLAAAPWDGSLRLRSAVANGVRSYKRIAALAGYLFIVAALGGVAEAIPALTFGLVILTAAVTGVVIVVLPRIGSQRSLLWPLPVVLAGALVFMTVWGVDRLLVREPEPPTREGSLMVMSGINSSSGNGAAFRLDPTTFGFTCEQMYYYSYAGPGDGAPDADAVCEIRTGAPFEGSDTHQPIDQLAENLALQVEGVPRPLTVVGHSHSAWIAWLTASTRENLPVDNVIVFSAFPESGHGYVDAHEEAPGRIASDLLRIIAPIAIELGMVLAIESPALERMLGDPDGPSEIMRAPLVDHIRGLSIVAATDLVLMPGGWKIGADVNACPKWVSHPTLPNAPEVAHEVNRFLDGGAASECRPVVASVLSAVSRPFGVPRHDQIERVFSRENSGEA